jgi:Xaa-Pro aminopeptidase
MTSHAAMPSPAARLEALTALRAWMRGARLDVFLVPSADPHQSEYVPGLWQRRAFISGFTGSVGDAVVGLEGAWQFADSRYWLQGEQELAGTPWSLVRVGDGDTPDLYGHLGQLGQARPSGAGLRVGYDPWVHTIRDVERLREVLEPVGGALVPVSENPIDALRPEAQVFPETQLAAWPVRFSGRATADKLSDLRAAMRARKADWAVVATLDELAWLFNVRARDVDFNPVAIGWGLVGLTSAELFTQTGRVAPEAASTLAEAGVTLTDYAAFPERLGGLSGTVWLDPTAAAARAAELVTEAGAKVHASPSPLLLPRARKNAVELAGMRAAHLRDAVAVVRFLTWLEDHWRDGLDELGAAERLAAFRAEGELFQGLSFDTIAGFGPNGAIVHYRASPETTRVIDDSTLFLLDSGGQYLDGTTDITRTLHLGAPTEAQRAAYTRVLRGHLALGRAIFPRGTTGTHLDALARTPLWEAGLNYGHGTGHGVGCFLSVHQGPQRIAPAWNATALEPGMILSNEPGYYEAGAWGIRVENLVIVREASLPTANQTFGPFYAFEDLTLVPHCRRLVDTTLLNAAERLQFDAYHARVRAAVLPLLADRDPRAAAWLIAATEPLEG